MQIKDKTKQKLVFYTKLFISVTLGVALILYIWFKPAYLFFAESFY